MEDFRFENPSDEKIRDILTQATTIAVVGLSTNLSRASFRIANYLKRRNYRIIPVNPKYPQILGEKPYAKLADVSEKVDIVDIFRRPEHIMPIVEDAIQIKAKVVWMQEGISNPQAAKKAMESGITVLMDRCIYKEHVRLL
ncbi:MAG: CoA-binding protein [candidate division Zixibacteria bacterium SM23_73_2]|nr:MAG: CoA-binding protein [candidate division Zixibacteria bacterium SM23_73_2]